MANIGMKRKRLSVKDQDDRKKVSYQNDNTENTGNSDNNDNNEYIDARLLSLENAVSLSRLVTCSEDDSSRAAAFSRGDSIYEGFVPRLAAEACAAALLTHDTIWLAKSQDLPPSKVGAVGASVVHEIRFTPAKVGPSVLNEIRVLNDLCHSPSDMAGYVLTECGRIIPRATIEMVLDMAFAPWISKISKDSSESILITTDEFLEFCDCLTSLVPDYRSRGLPVVLWSHLLLFSDLIVIPKKFIDDATFPCPNNVVEGLWNLPATIDTSVVCKETKRVYYQSFALKGNRTADGGNTIHQDWRCVQSSMIAIRLAKQVAARYYTEISMYILVKPLRELALSYLVFLDEYD